MSSGCSACVGPASCSSFTCRLRVVASPTEGAPIGEGVCAAEGDGGDVVCDEGLAGWVSVAAGLATPPIAQMDRLFDGGGEAS